MVLPNGVDLRAYETLDLHVVVSFRPRDAEAHHVDTVEAGKGAWFGDPVGNGADVIEPHIAITRQRDSRCREIRDRPRSSERANRLVVTANFRAPAGEIGIADAQLVADIDRSDADTLQRDRIETDLDLALDTADAVDAGDAANTLELADDHVLHEPGDLLRGLAGRDRGIGENRQPDDVDALDQRFVDPARQVGAHARDRVLDVVEGAIG